jgi:hypothetical protein
MSDRHRQLIASLVIYTMFTLLILSANVLNYVGEREGTLETLEPIAGMIMGFVAIPIFAIALPLWLARRWELEYSFWPRRKSWLAGVGVMLLYLWTENLILVALAHNVGGSVGLAVNGTLFNQVDELLWVTILLMAGLVAYMVPFEIRRRARLYRDGWWLRVEIDRRAL